MTTTTLESMGEVGGGWSRSQMLAVAGAVAGTAFVGYCVYFDRKRRSAPDYKQKVRQKRERKRQQRAHSSLNSNRLMPDINNPTEMQAFFLQEVQLGEELLSEGDTTGAVEHLGNAIVMCGQPQQLLQIFQQTLPPDIFRLLTEHLPHAKERMTSMFQGGGQVRGRTSEDEQMSQMLMGGPAASEGFIDAELE